MLRDERLELGHELGVATERQVGFDPILDRREAYLLQPGDLALCELPVSELRQRRSVPERKRLAQAVRSLARIGPLSRLRDQRLEPGQVNLVDRGLQQITGRPRLDPIGTDQLAQDGDVAVQRGLGGFRRLLPPQRLDQPDAGHHLLAMQEQHREQRPLFGTRGCHIAATLDNPQRPKQFELHALGLSHALARR